MATWYNGHMVDLVSIADPQYYVAIGRCAAACCSVFAGRDDTGHWKTCGFCGRRVMMVEGDDNQPRFIWGGSDKRGDMIQWGGRDRHD